VLFRSLIKLAKKNIIDINVDTSRYENNINLDMPVLDMDSNTVKFMAIKFFPNDIMQYFMKIEL
jgi:hypothetical protein